jgi:uncharacterized protein (TIRG00374 family)
MRGLSLRGVRFAMLAAGSAVFAWLLWSLGFTVIRQNVIATGWWFLAILGAWCVTYCLNSCTLGLLLGCDRHRVGPPRILGTIVAGFAMNYATPVLHMGGEPFRIMVLSEWIERARAVFATIAFKAFNTSATVTHWLIGLIVFVCVAPARQRAVAMVALVVLVSVLVATVVSIARAERGVFAALMAFASRRPRFGQLQRFLLAHETTLREIDVHLGDLGTMRQVWLGAWIFEVLARLAMTGEIFFTLRALGYDIPFTTALCIDAASSLALNVLFFVPFDLGVREGGLYLILPVFGLPPEVGIYAGLVSRVRELFWIGVGLLCGHLLAATSPARLSPARPDR